MTTTEITVPAKPKPQTLREELFSPAMTAQFKMALPAHVSVERFQRVVMTALQQEPKLLDCERKSLFSACVKCAQDGLVPDGRDAALVPFSVKGVPTATYMPMVSGILKKVRNSGELAAISSHVVYENDKFTWRMGDDESLAHEPPSLGADRGKAIGVYAIATLKSGEKMREVLPLAEIEKIRAVSRAKGDGPWTSWWEEMARKSAIRRLSKRLPMSTDRDEELRKVIERDDDLVDLGDGARDVTPANTTDRVAAALSAPTETPLAAVPTEQRAAPVPAKTEPKSDPAADAPSAPPAQSAPAAGPPVAAAQSPEAADGADEGGNGGRAAATASSSAYLIPIPKKKGGAPNPLQWINAIAGAIAKIDDNETLDRFQTGNTESAKSMGEDTLATFLSACATAGERIRGGG